MALSGFGRSKWHQPEALLRRSFASALAAAPKGCGPPVAQAGNLDHRNIWLSHSDNQPLDFAAPVKLGDRIEISGRGKERRALEVVDIRALETGLTPAEDAVHQLLVVSCREVGSKSDRMVRFVMEAEGLDTATRKVPPQRTL